MSELSKSARSAMKEKAHRLASGDPHQRVDSSSWTPSEPLNADAKTGMRPISRRAYKKGGKVEGEREKQRADRKPRKDGGKAIADAYMNRDQKEANEERPGVKHVGGFKRGGRARTHKDDGGSVMTDRGDPTLNGLASLLQLAAPIASAYLGRSTINNSNTIDNGGPSIPVAKKRGGRTKKADGGSFVPTERMAFSNGPSQMSKAAGYKNGGHPDEKEDRKLVKQMVKKPALTGKKTGGNVSVLNGGHDDGDRQARKHGGRADAHWIKGALAGGHKGALHKELNVADDKRIPQKKLEKAEHSSNKLVAKRAHLAETLEHMNKPEKAGGGRMARAEGGRTKGKTNINIVIAQPGRDEGSPPDQGPQMAPPPPPRPPMPAPAQLGGTPLPPPMPPQGGPPMGMPPGMPRKDGGRTVKVAHDMAEDGGGGGGGLGRLEKIRSYGHRA